MLEVSDAWKQAYTEMLSPETFVEIDLLMGRVLRKGEAGYHSAPIGSSGDVVAGGWETWEDFAHMLHQPNPIPPTYAATLEENLWVLDGTRKVLEARPCYNMGFCTMTDGNLRYSITWSHNEVQTDNLPLLTIVWSNEYKEYPHSFEVKIRYHFFPEGSEQAEYVTLKTIRVENNDSYISEIPVGVAGYTVIEIEAFDWNTPNHRKRMDQVFLGKIHHFDKKEIISFTHEESCDLLSATLPKNSIRFSVSNLDGRWNPHNPTGDSVYLMERQAVSVRYGTSTSSGVEWIPGGMFFLSEWNAPSNGVECTFVARDVFEFLLQEKTKTVYYPVYGSSGFIEKLMENVSVTYAGVQANGSEGFEITDFRASSDFSVAETFQLLANAYQRVLHHNRNNQISMTRLKKNVCDYPMPLTLAYSHPEITLSKPLRDIIIKVRVKPDTDADGDGYWDLTDKTVLTVRSDGESQTIDNRALYAWSDTELNSYAEWVRDTLVSRKTVSGEFRADPRLEVLDVVSIESKYGVIEPVALTTVKYTYNGSFRGYYEGRVIDG